MKSDIQLKADVSAELAWDPSINAAGIGVIVNDGIVILTGYLDSFAEKHAVEKAVRRVAGVRGIAVELEVRLPAEHVRTDADIAKAAIAALEWHSLVPHERVKVQVEDGWVALSGEVDWPYQRSSAEQSIPPLVGVRGVSNEITVKPRATQENISAQISAALARQAQREAGHIGIGVDGSVVTLTGKVHSLAEHDAAVGAAWSATGVGRVVDRLQVAD